MGNITANITIGLGIICLLIGIVGLMIGVMDINNANEYQEDYENNYPLVTQEQTDEYERSQDVKANGQIYEICGIIFIILGIIGFAFGSKGIKEKRTTQPQIIIQQYPQQPLTFQPQPTIQQTPPPSPNLTYCPYCKQTLSYISQYQKYWCNWCKKYI